VVLGHLGLNGYEEFAECFFHSFSGERAALGEEQAVGISERGGRMLADFPGMREIDLVAKEEELSVFVDASFALCQPLGQLIKSVLSGHLVHKHDTGSIAVEGRSNALELLLASGVPELEPDNAVIDDCLSRPEINADCGLGLNVE
jgi:hypothetical protein